MTRRDAVIRLRHMLDYALAARRLMKDRERHDLDHDEALQLALTRAVEIVGEAAFRIPPEERERYSEIPWVQIIGTRHRLVHGYDLVDPRILWDIVTDDLPPLIEALRAILEMENDQCD